MRATFVHINWKAVALAFVLAYPFPFLIACSIWLKLNNAIWLIWLMILAPIIAGYLVAKFAKIVPLMHGLIVSVVATIIYAFLYEPLRGNPLLFWIPINIACSIFGARLWRNRCRASNDL
jgi:hypothetical protein